MLLTLVGESQTEQDTGGARFGLVGFHLDEFLLDIAQRDIETFSFMVESGCIRRGIGHGGSLFFDRRQFVGDFLENQWGLLDQHTTNTHDGD